MATKKETLEAALRGEGCLGRAADDEVVFVVRAQDVFFGPVVAFWGALVAQASRGNPKVKDALNCVAAAGKWQSDNRSRLKIPD